jgi:RNA polymerase sigma-70 factor (ECF subfamily)
MKSTDPESELLENCRRGDAAAWDWLFDRHYDPLGRFVFQLSPDFTHEDVADVCQETFLTVIRKLDSFKGGCRFQTWLFTIALNKARDLREKRRAAKRGGGLPTVSMDAPDAVTGRPFEMPSPGPRPDATLIRRENLMLVGRALESLQDACREIIELRYFADLSYSEIGETLHLNEKTVSSRLSRCLGRLEAVVKDLFQQEKAGISPSHH